jgi:putative transposase
LPRFFSKLRSITRNTVKKILKRNSYYTGPNRGPATWDEFLKRHAKTMWQCDFFSKKIVSKTGLRDIFDLVFLNIKTRQVYLTPSKAWMIEQTEALIKHTKDKKLPCKK